MIDKNNGEQIKTCTKLVFIISRKQRLLLLSRYNL